MLRFTLILLFALGTAAPTAASGATEYIVVSGGPALRQWENYRASVDRHDQWWGNFVRSARLRFEQLREELGPDARITWLVYKPGYEKRASEDGRPFLDFIRSVRSKYELDLVWFKSGSDFIYYVNAGHNRSALKISGLEYFGHSNKHCWLFDYSSYILGASKAFFHETDCNQIDRRAFAKDPFIKSWGCHTAESMSKQWRYHTKTRMQGAIGKTDYSYLYEGKMPYISTPGGKWTE